MKEWTEHDRIIAVTWLKYTSKYTLCLSRVDFFTKFFMSLDTVGTHDHIIIYDVIIDLREPDFFYPLKSKGSKKKVLQMIFLRSTSHCSIQTNHRHSWFSPFRSKWLSLKLKFNPWNSKITFLHSTRHCSTQTTHKQWLNNNKANEGKARGPRGSKGLVTHPNN